MVKKGRRGKRTKKVGERSLAQIIRVFPEQAYEVERWAKIWGIALEDVLKWGTTEFNRRRAEVIITK